MKENIEYILENFDFEKVQKVMNFLDWRWSTKNSSYVPKFYHLIKTAEELLTNAYKGSSDNKKDWACATGGFEARAEYSEDEINLYLEFILESYSNY